MVKRKRHSAVGMPSKELALQHMNHGAPPKLSALQHMNIAAHEHCSPFNEKVKLLAPQLMNIAAHSMKRSGCRDQTLICHIVALHHVPIATHSMVLQLWPAEIRALHP